jgi:hypothetical protein
VKAKQKPFADMPLSVPNPDAAGRYVARQKPGSRSHWREVVWVNGKQEFFVGEFTPPGPDIYSDYAFIVQTPEGFVALTYAMDGTHDVEWHCKNMCGAAVHALMVFFEIWETPELRAKLIECRRTTLPLFAEAERLLRP